MRVIVCIKQVPNTNEVKINKETGTLIREGVPSIINPDDKNAIEEALRLKDENPDLEVLVLCMGPPQAEHALREALAMGADKGILLGDRSFAGSDTWATATILATAVNKIGDYDIVFCGRQAIDGDTAQVGPQVAERLGIPQITYVQKLQVEGNHVIVQRMIEDGYYVLKSQMPVMLTAIKELNKPRYPQMLGIIHAYSSEANLEYWSAEKINVDYSQIGVKNSPTNVFRSFVPVREFKGETLEGSNREISETLIVKMHELNLV